MPKVLHRFCQGRRVHDERTVELGDGDTIWMIGMGRGDQVRGGIKSQDSRPRRYANQEVPTPKASLH